MRSQVVNVEGTDRLEAIVVENRDTGEQRREETDALFVFIGADAETSWLPREIIRDERGYVCTGRDVIDLVAASQGTLAARARSVSARNERARHLRRRRRAPRFDQARRVRRRRRQHGDCIRPSIPGRTLRRATAMRSDRGRMTCD